MKLDKVDLRIHRIKAALLAFGLILLCALPTLVVARFITDTVSK